MSGYLNLSANNAVNDALVRTSFASSFHGANFTLAIPQINISDEQLIDPGKSLRQAKRKSTRLVVAILATAACGTVGILAPKPADLLSIAESAYQTWAAKPAARPQTVAAQAAPVAQAPAPTAQAPTQETTDTASQGSQTPPGTSAPAQAPAPATTPAVAVASIMPPSVPPLPSGPIASPMPPAPGQVTTTKPITNLDKPLPVIPLSGHAIASVAAAKPQVAEQVVPSAQHSPLLVLEREAQQPTASASVPPEEQTSNQFAIPATPKHGASAKQKRNADPARQIAAKQPPALESDQEKSARLLSRVESKSSDSVKRLLTTSAEKYGIRSLQPEGILIESKAGPDAQPLVILLGDYLPNGERLIRVDPKANTVVTDRSVIRFN